MFRLASASLLRAAARTSTPTFSAVNTLRCMSDVAGEPSFGKCVETYFDEVRKKKKLIFPFCDPYATTHTHTPHQEKKKCSHTLIYVRIHIQAAHHLLIYIGCQVHQLESLCAQ